MSRIILLNGISSSGKSTIAKALQQSLPEPWLHVQMDSFIDMLPSGYIGTEGKAVDGFHFIKQNGGAEEHYALNIGHAGKRLLDGMRQSVGVLADAGNDIILDEVIYGQQEFVDYSRYLLGHKVYIVNVTCPLHVAEARERRRQDRYKHVRSQYDLVNTEFYDLLLDSSNAVADALATKIKNMLDTMSNPIALVEWQTKYNQSA